MLFKIDENMPTEITEMLISTGHDAKTLHEQLLKGIIDSVLLNVCKDENRVLVTLDTDFSDIRTYPPQEFSGIIVLRVGSQAKQDVIKVFQGILSFIDREHLKQHFWIVEETRIRISGANNE